MVIAKSKDMKRLSSVYQKNYQICLYFFQGLTDTGF